MIRRFLVLAIGLGAVACSSPPKKPLFVSVSPQVSGLDFSNTIQENEQLNVLEYQYLYNGGGVAIGDVNNDGLSDIYFSGNMVPNKLYLNTGHLTFRDVTAQSGVTGRKQWKTGVSMADINGDGRLDLYLCYSGPGSDSERRNELYINTGVKDGIPQFTERAADYGLDAPGTFTTQATFFDMDRDGDLDLFMVNHANMFYNSFFNTTRLRNTRHPAFGNRLYRNDNGHFTDSSEPAGIHGSGLNFGLSAAISDLNNDGWPDIYVTNDYNERDFMYLNQQDGRFREVLNQSTGHIAKFAMGSDIADYNNDGLADIVTVDMLPEDNKRQKLLKGPDEYDVYQLLADSGFHHQNMRNMLQVNMGTTDQKIPLFSEMGQLAGISNTDWSWSPLLGDFDNDGWKDLFITNGYLRDFTNMDFLKYTYQEYMTKAQASGQHVDKWKLVQQMPTTKLSNYCFANDHTLSFQNVTQRWGLDQLTISTGAAYADLDNDGDLDLVVNNSNDPATLYENQWNQVRTNHYLTLRLNGEQANRYAIGAKVTIETNHGKQVTELYPVRGFQSSGPPELHFGLGADTLINSVRIQWPNGKQTQLTHLRVDTMLVLSPIANSISLPVDTLTHSPWFVNYTAQSGLMYKHQETPKVDFKDQSLLPYQVSRQGPFMTTGDVNGDGLDDLFVGGNFLHPGELFIQSSHGHFKKATSQPWANQTRAKNGGVLLFDADGDQDNDLLVVQGGTDWPAQDERYQDQLYVNDGQGGFSLATNALPNLSANGSCATADDYDHDGDLDLFIGGYATPGRFPETDFSYVLRNESQPGKPRFVYASEQADRTLRHPGLVTTATWADVNGDGWNDLLVAGEFMPITVYENRHGQLINATAAYGLKNATGLWHKLLATDMDGDGDIDLVAGNIGLNNQFRTSVNQPLELCYGDFDENGTVDPLLCYYIQGKRYPLASLDELSTQLPAVRKKFLRYAAYAQATFDQLLTAQQLKIAKMLTATVLTSSYLENQGYGHFALRPLPLLAQTSVLSGIVAEDVNQDGKKDLILSGNFYPWRVQLGRNDASMGVVCLGNGHGQFDPQLYNQTGLRLRGDIRDMLAIKTSDGVTLWLCTRNNDSTLIVKQASKHRVSAVKTNVFL